MIAGFCYGFEWELLPVISLAMCVVAAVRELVIVAGLKPSWFFPLPWCFKRRPRLPLRPLMSEVGDSVSRTGAPIPAAEQPTELP